MDYYFDAFRRYSQITGRADRRSFWMFILYDTLLGLVLYSLIEFSNIFLVIVVLYGLVAFVPKICLMIRRLHDSGRSGLNLLWYLLPAVGWIIVIIYFVLPSNKGENEYGADPSVPVDI